MKTKLDILKWWNECGFIQDKNKYNKERNDLKDFIEKTKNEPINYKIKDCKKIKGLESKKIEVWTKRSKKYPVWLYFLKDPVWICIHIRGF